MGKPVGYAFLRGRRRLRAGLSQLALVLAGFVLGLLMPVIDIGPTVPATQVTDMLVAVGLGLLGSIAVIFSLLFLVLQWAATTFTPRLTLFRDDPIVWRTFAFAVGQAIFSITAALAIGTRNTVSVLVPVIAVVLLLAMLGLLRALQLRAFAAIQLAPALRSVGDRGRAVLAAYYSSRTATAASAPLAEHSAPTTIVWPDPPAVLQHILVDDLLAATTRADVVVVLRVMPGVTLLRGLPVADVHRGPVTERALLDCLVTGRERTFDGDPLLAIRLLADIALRALSAAINDPATAVQALDEMDDLLTRVARADTDPIHLTDDLGQVRIALTRPTLADFVRTGLDDVIACAAASPMTICRLEALLLGLRGHCAPDDVTMLTARQNWTDELKHRFTHLDPPEGSAIDAPPGQR